MWSLADAAHNALFRCSEGTDPDNDTSLARADVAAPSCEKYWPFTVKTEPGFDGTSAEADSELPKGDGISVKPQNGDTTSASQVEEIVNLGEAGRLNPVAKEEHVGVGNFSDGAPNETQSSPARTIQEYIQESGLECLASSPHLEAPMHTPPDPQVSSLQPGSFGDDESNPIDAIRQDMQLEDYSSRGRCLEGGVTSGHAESTVEAIKEFQHHEPADMIHAGTQTEENDYFGLRRELKVPESPGDAGPEAQTPGIIVPDAPMIGRHLSRSLRRKRKMSISQAEETVASAVIIYAVCESLRQRHYHEQGGSLAHLQTGNVPEQGENGLDAAIIAPNSRQEESNGDLSPVTDPLAEAKSRDSTSPRIARDAERQRRHRQSPRADLSKRTRDDGELKQSRRRSSHDSSGSQHSSRRRHRTDSTSSGASRTPPRTPTRRDSGFSAQVHVASDGKPKSPDEQAARDRRREGRHIKNKDHEHRSRGKEHERRSSRHHSYSSHTGPDTPQDGVTLADKKFFDVKNSEGVVQGMNVARRRGEAASEGEGKQGLAPEPSRHHSTVRSKHKSSRREARGDGTADESKHATLSKAPPEDAARSARHRERRMAKEDDKKPSGIKAVLRRLFT